MTEDGRGKRRLRKPKQLHMKEKIKRDVYKFFVRKKSENWELKPKTKSAVQCVEFSKRQTRHMPLTN